MKDAVLLLNFGEPERPGLAEVVRYLERIFRANATLDPRPPADVGTRSRELAERRAPSLLEVYRRIGGSPLNEQARAQAKALEAELARRGVGARTYVGMQFTEPLIHHAVARAREDGAERLVGLPVYPLCGRSTTVAALEEMARATRELDWDVEIEEIAGWHRHPVYVEIRASAIRRHARRIDVDLEDPSTRLVFSAHGTPLKYLEDGNRYDRYVEEWCRSLADRLGASRFTLGFQNHANRGVAWTQPDIEDAVRTLGRSGSATEGPDPEVRRIVVDPVSFMHEQSETLAELDEDLRAVAEDSGLEFHRVPVPWDDPRFAAVLADLVEALIGAADPDGLRASACRCRPGASCLNASAPRVVTA